MTSQTLTQRSVIYIIIGYKFFHCKTFWVEVSNKLYVHNIKEILADPTRRFPHTSVSSTCSCHLQQGQTNPEYLIVLCKTYPSGGKKRLQGCARLFGLWVIASTEALLTHASLYSISLAVTISSLTNHSI